MGGRMYGEDGAMRGIYPILPSARYIVHDTRGGSVMICKS